jgi:serine phosphatase RsbU (regulator of sigma subunit)
MGPDSNTVRGGEPPPVGGFPRMAGGLGYCEDRPMESSVRGSAAGAAPALRHPEALLAAAERAAGLGSWEWDLHTGVQRWSDGLYRLLGVVREAVAPSWVHFLAAVHPDDRARVAADARSAVGDDAVPAHQRDFRVIALDDGARTVAWTAQVLRNRAGVPTSLIGTAQDLTEQRQTERELKLAADASARAEHTQQLRAITDAALSGLSLDALISELLARVAEALPATTAALLLFDGPGEELLLRATHGLAEPAVQTAVIAPGRGLAARVSEQRRAVSMTGPEIAGLRLTALRRMGAVAGAPLLVGPRMIGVLEVGRGEALAFGADELALLQLAADRTAMALDHARAVARERHIAQTLQRSLLPEALPTIAGIELTARFLPAGEGQEVGGDFYDVTALGGDRWLLVLGDVCGKGPEAAALTAMVRYTLRAEAMHEPRPGELIGLLNDAIVAHRSAVSFCTVLCLVLDLSGEHPRLTVASGGHPMPLIVHDDSAVEYPDNPGGPIVGVFPGVDFGQATLTLAPGDTVIAFTDGLLEAHAPEQILTPRELGEAVRLSPRRPLPAFLQALEDAALGASIAPVRDDIAILAFGVDAPAAEPGERVAARRRDGIAQSG